MLGFWEAAKKLIFLMAGPLGGGGGGFKGPAINEKKAFLSFFLFVT